jgi:hypothetical protein
MHKLRAIMKISGKFENNKKCKHLELAAKSINTK